MACSSCYNNCPEIVSDKCVKYTGVNVPVLEIKQGDSLSYVTQALVSFLVSALDGSGIKINLDEADYCELVSQYLQECETVTAFDLFKALVKASCNIQSQIDSINSTLNTLNADYTVDCLSGVTASSDTHDVVQAVISKLCALEDVVSALSIDVDTNYVKLSELNSLIKAYIDSTAVATKYSSRMVPYAIQAYYGSLSVFDATGAGLTSTEWEDIYLCNGENGTPDLRGRAIVGAISGVPGGTLDSTRNPSSSAFNPNYSKGTPYGANSVTLTEQQIPSHTHTAVANGDHSHTVIAQAGTDTNSGALVGGVASVANDGEATTSTDGEHTHTIQATGGGEAHTNVQPVLPTYWIMYIPS